MKNTIILGLAMLIPVSLQCLDEGQSERPVEVPELKQLLINQGDPCVAESVESPCACGDYLLPNQDFSQLEDFEKTLKALIIGHTILSVCNSQEAVCCCSDKTEQEEYFKQLIAESEAKQNEKFAQLEQSDKEKQKHIEQLTEQNKRLLQLFMQKSAQETTGG